ncbi:Hsp70 family protein [Altericista sp. CCNU0014]|uniref:Hsp70 family protein n=1 Tax=Altericista sp. CCNU0014 TaxID=3082949 RepID=UPI00384ED493
MSYAIDFGTSNTVVARWNAASQQAETLSLKGMSLRVGQNPDLIPSLVYVENAVQPQVLVGQQVRDRGLDIQSDPRFFRGFKRGIGTPVRGFLPEIDGQSIRFEQVGQWFLATVVDRLKASYTDAGNALVLTVPVDSFEPYRQWLGQVCQSLQVEQVRMLDEPTAAALGYGKADADVVLVVDFGGGTLDLALVQLDRSRSAQTKPMGFILKWGNKNLAEESAQRPKTARVLAKAGQNLGGTDLDNWVLDRFAKVQDLPKNPLTQRLAERLKIQLSLQAKATEVYFNEETFESYELTLDRAEFEAILKERQFFERLDDSMTQVLQQARRQGITPEKIDAVLLVGGTSLIPAVQTWVQQYFDATKISSSKPFEAIAQGALQILQGTEVKDFLYHSYGIRYWDRRLNSHNWHTIVQPGQPYPMPEPVELILGASAEGQPSIELIIGELGKESSGTEVYFDGDRLITRTLSANQGQVQALNDREGARSIAQLDPPGFPGSDRIKVLFRVDEGRSLRITVEDLLTQEVLVTDRVVAQLS